VTRGSVIAIIAISFNWFVFQVISNAPVHLVFSKVNKLLAPTVYISNPQGSLFSGTASSIRIHSLGSPLVFERVTWKLSTWKLIIGQLALDVSSSKSSQASINGSIAMKLTRTLELKDFNIQLPASKLAQNLTMQAPISGLFNLKSDHIKFNLKEKKLTHISKSSLLTWEKAEVNLGKNVVLGDYKGIVTEKKSGQFLISISDDNAKLKVNGNVMFKLNPFKYDVDMNIEKTDELPVEFTNMLSYLGRENAKGIIKFKTSN
jgi:hypothetical protein